MDSQASRWPWCRGGPATTIGAAAGAHPSAPRPSPYLPMSPPSMMFADLLIAVTISRLTAHGHSMLSHGYGGSGGASVDRCATASSHVSPHLHLP